MQYEDAIDEVSWRKQHRYLTLVADHIRGHIVWGTEGNSQAAADRFFKDLGKSRSHAVEVISLDMGPGYAKSAREHAPNAIIAIDPYHVVALANRALDEVRRGYWNELRRVGDRDAARRFKDARWSLLKAPKNLSEKQAVTLRRLKAAGGEVWRAYTLKEALRAIFAPSLTVEDVTVLIDRFISKAARSRLEPFLRLSQTIRRHRDGILHAIRLGINQGRTEALNNKVRLITRRAYGFHSANAALALVMLTGRLGRAEMSDGRPGRRRSSLRFGRQQPSEVCGCSDDEASASCRSAMGGPAPGRRLSASNCQMLWIRQ